MAVVESENTLGYLLSKRDLNEKGVFPDGSYIRAQCAYDPDKDCVGNSIIQPEEIKFTLPKSVVTSEGGLEIVDGEVLETNCYRCHLGGLTRVFNAFGGNLGEKPMRTEQLRVYCGKK